MGRNRCYFCDCATSMVYALNHDVVACSSCRFKYRDVPSHIPVEQVDRYWRAIHRKMHLTN